MVEQITKLKIGSSSLKRYADLDYDEWYAIAEFVDNSLHSFLHNKSELKKISINACDVKISNYKEDDVYELHIQDNSGGIHTQDFERVVSFGEEKEKCETQLSQFGMGMKTASIWLGKQIEIDTKHYLEDKSHKIVINFENLGKDNEVKITETRPSSNLKCYTKIKILNLNRNIERKKKKIKTALASIYRKYIENGDLRISFQDEELQPLSIKLRTDSLGNDARKNFEITVSNGRKLKGWLGIMTEGKGVLSGFSIYRHNRLIRGYPEGSWKPTEVFGGDFDGGSNTLKNQRLIGELDMTEFDVAHTKNGINFKGTEEADVRKGLELECEEIARESNRSNKSKTVKDHEEDPNVQIGRDAIEEFFGNPINTDVKTLEYVAPTIKKETKTKIKEIYENDKFFMNLSIMKSVVGIEKEVFVYHFQDSKLPYMILDEIDNKLIVCINIRHPYYSDINENGTPEKVRNFTINCVFDALSESHNQEKFGTKIQPEDIRLTKDLFLKKWTNHQNG